MRVRAVLAVFTTKDVLDKQASGAVLQLMRKHGYALRELRYAKGDRIKIPLNDDAFAELWTGYARPGGYSGAYWTASLFGKGARDLEYLRWGAFVSPHRMESPVLVVGLRSPIIFGFLKPRVPDMVENLVRFGHDVCVALRATFGYVTLLIDNETSSWSEPEVGDRLDTVMPGIYWRTFVGQPWLERVKERTRDVEHLDQEESEGLLTLKMDADPLSPDVLRGSLASRLMEVLHAQLFAPGALPAASYSELERKAECAVFSPPEATVDAAWRSGISADLRRRSIEEVITALALRGKEIADGFTLGVSPEDTLDDLGDAIRADFRGARPAVPRDELVTALGAYCGEIMREDFGGRWDVNPRFPGNPGLRKGQVWVYPLGVMDRALSRLAVPGPCPDEYYRALSEIEHGCDDSLAFSLTPPVRQSPITSTGPCNTHGERLVEYARRCHRLELDYSTQSLQLLDGIALELYQYSDRDREIFGKRKTAHTLL